MTVITTFFQVASTVVFGVTLWLVFVGWRRYPDYRMAFFPVLLLAGYGVVYYALVLGGRLTAVELLLWGAVHRFLAGVVIMGGTAGVVWALGGKDDGG